MHTKQDRGGNVLPVPLGVRDTEWSFSTSSIPLHNALTIRQPSYTAGMAVVLYSTLTMRDHYATCTLSHVNSHYYMEKHGVITGLQTAMLSCATPSL